MSTALAQKDLQAPSSLLPSAAEWNTIKEQATILVKSKLLPAAIDTPEKAIAIALKGRELGIPMMQAFAHIHIINGKPTISAELMLALIFRNCQGAVINYAESTSQTCVIEAKRPGGKALRIGFSIDEAKKAGLLSKDSWVKYPSAMLRARAIAIVARALFPDAIMGCSYTPEELGANVNDDGEVIDIPNSTRPPDIIPDQPGEEDGTKHEDEPYRITFGKFNKRSLEEIGPKDLGNYVNWLEANSKKTGEPLSERANDFIARASKYIADFENGTLEAIEDSKL